MRKLILIILTSLPGLLTAQCISSCVDCTQPTGVSFGIHNNQLYVGWNNNWQWGYGCTKGVSVLVNGTEYFGNVDGALWTEAHSTAAIPGFVPVAGEQICVQVRNYCSTPRACNPMNYVDSEVVCDTPVGIPNMEPCRCGPNLSKYHVTRGTEEACVNRLKCLRMVNEGWTSVCGCQ
jgi:hypothetical protein